MILTFDDRARILDPGDVLVRGAEIAAVGQSLAGTGAGRIIDADGALVLPGLVNAHTHSPETLSRGCVEHAALEDWLPEIWTRLDRLTARQIRVAALLGCIEMLRSGVTTVLDHFRQTPMREDAVEAVVGAYRTAGIRTMVAVMVRGGAGADPDPARLCESAIAAWHRPDEGVSILLGPSAPHRCDDALLAALGRLSADHGVGIHTHLDETRRQREEARALYGRSTVAHLDDLGLLSPRLSAAHAVWVDDDDIDRLRRGGAAVVHNPVSNLRLGSGIAPLAALSARGIPVALGTDGAASNDGQDMFEAVKLAAMLPALAGVAPEARPTAYDALAMATRTPGAVFGGNSGVLEAGRAADLIVVDAADCRFRPMNDVYRQLAYCGPGLRVRYALVDGRVVVDDGVITTFDEGEVYAEAEDVARQLH